MNNIDDDEVELRRQIELMKIEVKKLKEDIERSQKLGRLSERGYQKKGLG